MFKRKYTDELLKNAISTSKNWKEVCYKLGVGNTHQNADSARRRAKNKSIDFSHFSWKRSYSKDELKKAVSEVKSYYQLLLKLGLNGYGSSYRNIKRAIKSCNLDVSHFEKKPQIFSERLKLENVFIKDSPISSTTNLKKIIFREKLKERKCEICGIETWRGQPVPIELDHINGDNNDCRLENLRIVCRNCGGLLPTFCRGQKMLR